MKKYLLAWALFCSLTATSQTQHRAENPDKRVRSIEVEIGVGIVVGAGKLNFDKAKTGGMGFGEIRYNFRHLPIDVGVQVAGNVFHRWSKNAGDLGFTSVNCIAVADYNFFREKKVSFFAGVGFGYASLETTAPIRFDDSQPNWGGFIEDGEKSAICFMPRIGVEFFHRLRLTFDYKLEEKANRHCNVSIGVVFGGGRRK